MTPRSFLQKAGVPLAAVAEVMGVPRSTLYQWIVKGVPPNRKSDRLLLGLVFQAITDAYTRGTQTVPPGREPAERRTRIIRALPKEARRILQS